MNWLAKIKNILCRYTCIIEFCHNCGRKQPLVWWCPDNKLWCEITGEKEIDGECAGVLCPKCFDKIASQKGISIEWIAKEEFRFNL